MSVIYKTLKKLKTETADKKNSKNILVRRKRIFFFKNALYSPSYVLLILLILTVICAGTLYGYYHFRETKGAEYKDFVVFKSNVIQSKDLRTNESSEDNKVKRLDWTKQSESSQIEYIPPRANENIFENYASSEPNVTSKNYIAVKEALPKTKVANQGNNVVKSKVEKVDKLLVPEVSAVPEIEKIFVANANKNAKIARLVADIRWEMERGDQKRTKTLLDELATLKGQNNSYFLKLKAVWHIHNKEYERAEDLLKAVLAKNELDQEAGINMAIIEINTKQMENAYRRLKKLRTIYPENIRIAEIMQDLKLLFNKAPKYRIQHKES